ncbi:hypothetical protein [Synechococcus sp. CBW1006]|uniref:hypothetical protein n=1 Tax=Synechococcus sp. CBW1006 TaxID=1353138 RepID=UPI001E31091F|nr:hypothetical protein [Synechococcus sp. CBW1006]
MTATDPTDGSLGKSFTALIVKTVPFKMYELTPKHDDGPAHGDIWLCDQGPPIAFTFGLFSQTIKRTILAKVNKIFTVLTTEPPLPGKLTPLHFDHQGGLMEQSNASLQRGRQG